MKAKRKTKKKNIKNGSMIMMIVNLCKFGQWFAWKCHKILQLLGALPLEPHRVSLQGPLYPVLWGLCASHAFLTLGAMNFSMAQGPGKIIWHWVAWVFGYYCTLFCRFLWIVLYLVWFGVHVAWVFWIPFLYNIEVFQWFCFWEERYNLVLNDCLIGVICSYWFDIISVESIEN